MYKQHFFQVLNCNQQVHSKWWKITLLYLLYLLLFQNNIYAQSCSCTDYILLNETGVDEVHKFPVDPVTGMPIGPGTIYTDQVGFPHGGGMDLNGNVYMNDFNDSRIVKLDCEGNILDANFVTGFRFSNGLTIENTLYTAGAFGLVAFDLCSATQIGNNLCMNNGISFWGLDISDSGTLYASGPGGGGGVSTDHIVVVPNFSVQTLVDGTCFDPTLTNVDFIDITASAGIGSVGNPLQAIARDFDNDGYLDLLVSGDTSYLFQNNGDKTYSKIEWEIGLDSLKSFAIGDLNNDGFEDVYGSYYYLESSNEKPDQLWLNAGNENNFLKVNLEGIISNKSAIGAKVKLFTDDDQILVREVRSGESYGINNSLIMNFGLGNRSIDSLMVQWPSGIKDRLYDITANQQIDILEGSTITSNVTEQELIHQQNPYFYNQASNELTLIDSFEESQINAVQVFDATGRLIISQRNNVSSIALPDLLSGMYFIQITYTNFEENGFKIIRY